MSAREELAYAAGALTPALKVGELLDAYRAEVLREAAEKIRQWADKNERHFLEGERTGVRMVADLIDVFTP